MMREPDAVEKAGAGAEAEVLAALEPEQLSSAKRRHFARHKLGKAEVLLLWGLRIYVVVMMVAVIYQFFKGTQ